MSYRLSRLANDAEEIRRSLINHHKISISKALGSPPDKYEIEYRVKGLEIKDEGPIERTSHRVEIVLTLDYPRLAPKCRMLTPVFHPNISPDAICIVDHWAAGESLLDIIFRIGEMICFQNYNIKSPRNGEAAKWASENMQRFPLDGVDLRCESRPEAVNAVVRSLADPEGPKSCDLGAVQVDRCSNCGAPAGQAGLSTCSSGHRVCSDCALECGCCAKSICVLCTLTRCSYCGEVVCADCRRSCNSCGQTGCRKDLAECAICGATICKKCVSSCSQCGKPHCSDHFDAASSLCTSCLAARGAADDGRREPSERGSSTEIHSGLGDRCPTCGANIADREARFCEMCGGRIRQRSVSAGAGKPSDSKGYRIIYEGKIADGKTIGEVKGNMIKVWKIDKSRIDALFEGRRIIVSKELDYASAMRRKEVFERQTGALFRIEKCS